MLLRILCILFGHRRPIPEAEAARIRAEHDAAVARVRRSMGPNFPNR